MFFQFFLPPIFQRPGLHVLCKYCFFIFSATAVPTNPSTGVTAEASAPQESNRPPKVSAQSLFSQRPGPPSTPPTSKSKTDTPGTGVLSSDSQSATHNKDEEQQQPQKEQSAVDNDTPTEESSPADTPNESPETQATDTVVASSPEPASESRQDVDLAAADIPTLQNMEKAACERVAFHETRLASAREHLTRIKKRLKRMQDGQSPGTPQASPVADLEMEIIDWSSLQPASIECTWLCETTWSVPFLLPPTPQMRQEKSSCVPG